MGLWDRLTTEFIDIIEWLDKGHETMVWRFPRHKNEIKNGAQLIVRESQLAVFVDQGRIADVFAPGRYVLSTQNLPILSTLKGWKYGFNSPFKAEVYFVSTKTFTARKWGTKNPIMLRDPEFGPIRLRAFGNYAIKVTDATKFIEEIAGTDAHFTLDELTNELRNIIITRFTDALGESKIPILDLAANYDELSKFIHQKINPEFTEYGLTLTKFLVENISLPAKVEEALDKRSSMGIIGNLDQYMKYQAAESLEKAAENPSGGANQGVGLGMGLGMAQQMMKSMNNQTAENNTNTNANNNKTVSSTPPPLPPQVEFWVAQDGKRTGPFSTTQLKTLVDSGKLTRETLVWKTGLENWVKASESVDLVDLFTHVPPPLPPL